MTVWLCVGSVSLLKKVRGGRGLGIVVAVLGSKKLRISNPHHTIAKCIISIFSGLYTIPVKISTSNIWPNGTLTADKRMVASNTLAGLTAMKPPLSAQYSYCDLPVRRFAPNFIG